MLQTMIRTGYNLQRLNVIGVNFTQDVIIKVMKENFAKDNQVFDIEGFRMSQLKDFSQVSQEQLLKELQTYDLKPGVLSFLKDNPAILAPLMEITSELKETFSDCKIELKVSEKEGLEKLRINILAPDKTIDVIIRFNEFKRIWWLDKFDNLRDLALLNIKFPESEDNDDWNSFDDLIGTVEGPADWASEIDHYLYGTPKLNQK